MSPLQTAALIGLVLYFALLLFVVTREKKSHNVLDYFFAGRSLPFWALSITFVASWWGRARPSPPPTWPTPTGWALSGTTGLPVLLATFLMMLEARAIRRVPFLTQGAMMEARYSPAVARLLSVMILIFMTFSAASQMVGIGSFFSAYLGLDYTLAVLAGTGIVLIYSLFGGFRGVVLTGMAGSVLFDTLPEGGVVPAFWASQSTAQILLGVGLSLAAYVVVSLCTPPDTDRADRFIQQAGLLCRHSS